MNKYPSIETHRLRYLAAVIEYGGFAQAAAALHVTQPAVSTAIKKLEEALGQTLLDRQSKPIALTVFGKAVYRSWHTHVNEQKRLIRELDGMQDLNSAKVSVVIGATFPIQPVVAALESLRQKYPGFHLSIIMGTYTNNIASVIDGSVDIILSQLPEKGADPLLAHENLISDRFHLICRKSHPLAQKSTISWQEIVEYPWSAGGPFEAFLKGWKKKFSDHGVVAPEATLYTTSILATLAAVSEHNYLAMLPVGYISEELTRGQFCTLPMPELEFSQEKGASWLSARSLSPGALAYMNELRRTIALWKGPR